VDDCLLALPNNRQDLIVTIIDNTVSIYVHNGKGVNVSWAQQNFLADFVLVLIVSVGALIYGLLRFIVDNCPRNFLGKQVALIDSVTSTSVSALPVDSDQRSKIVIKETYR
jgi:hypothetical protein